MSGSKCIQSVRRSCCDGFALITNLAGWFEIHGGPKFYYCHVGGDWAARFTTQCVLRKCLGYAR